MPPGKLWASPSDHDLTQGVLAATGHDHACVGEVGVENAKAVAVLEALPDYPAPLELPPTCDAAQPLQDEQIEEIDVESSDEDEKKGWSEPTVHRITESLRAPAFVGSLVQAFGQVKPVDVSHQKKQKKALTVQQLKVSQKEPTVSGPAGQQPEPAGKRHCADPHGAPVTGAPAT
jgi:hypothetical protein